MLRLRRAEPAARLTADAARLTGTEARLQMIEDEGHMPTADIQLKRLPVTRVAELTGTAAGYEPEHIGPVIQPLYPELMRRLDEAGVPVIGPGIAYYEDAPDGAITVHAGLQVAVAPDDAYDFAVIDLPGVEAATIVHRGSMDSVLTAHQLLARWMEAGGHRAAGYARELYLECPADEPDAWVTELQVPLA